MEIERKYLISSLPEHLEQYPHRQLEQGYLSTSPVVRVRKDDDKYELTYKSKRLITKKRYCIPYGIYTIELDIFEGDLAPLVLAEVEFPTEQEANAFTPPDWFIEDVTFSPLYHNSFLSQLQHK